MYDLERRWLTGSRDNHHILAADEDFGDPLNPCPSAHSDKDTKS
jgi:hypothetical protein